MDLLDQTRIDRTYLPADYYDSGLQAEFYPDGSLRAFGRQVAGVWVGWKLELGPRGGFGTARRAFHEQPEQSEMYSNGYLERFEADDRPIPYDWEDWVVYWIASIAGSPAPSENPPPEVRPVGFLQRLLRMAKRAA